MRNININFFNVFLVFSLSACSNAAENKPTQLSDKSRYSISESDLNNIYSDIKTYVIDNKVEIKDLVETQRSWLKNRNSKCNYNGRDANSENYKCLSDFNDMKIKELKKSYLFFDGLEGRLIKPFKYKNGIMKELDVGGCNCSESSIKILKNKIYIYQACDKNLQEPRIYNIVGKKKDVVSVEYMIDTNSNDVPEFNLSFVTNGKNVWTVIPKVFRGEDLVNLNFKINYTTDVELEEKNINCDNYD
jgi:uncharacterized protein YecT (DUF1311 family)